jgi:hypothetical protein
MKYIFYKKKVAGPIKDELLDFYIKMWKEKVDAGELESLNEDMQNYPNDVHILQQGNQ